MAKYRKISPRIWNDSRVRKLTDKGKLAFLFMLTHPGTMPFGAIRANVPGLACELGWSVKAFRKALDELCSLGMAMEDREATLIWFPNFLKHNRPESPNVVKSWAGAFEDLPECPLRDAICEALLDVVQSMGKGFQEAFAEAFAEVMPEALLEGLSEGLQEGLPEALPKTSPNQEQEQEQKQDNKNTPPLPPQGELGEGKRKPRKNLPASQKPSRTDECGTQNEPGMEFLELRELWDREMRCEGPMAGFREYKMLKKARDGTSMSCWPGLGVICDDVCKRKAARVWNPGYEIGLGRYLAEKTWLAPVIPRASPAGKPDRTRESESERAARLTWENGQSIIAELEAKRNGVVQE